MVPKNPSTEQVIKQLEQYKKFLNDIPNEEEAKTFENIWKTLITVIKNNSMSGGGKNKCQKCIPNASGTKCMVCRRPLGNRSSRRARSRTRTGRSYGNELQRAIVTKGKRLKVPSELLEHAKQLGKDLAEATPREKMGNLVNNDLYSFVLRLFNQAQAELDMSAGFQAKNSETRFYNLYLYVFIPLSCLLCTGVNGYLWYNFCNTFIWIIEENTAAVDYAAGISGRRDDALEQARRTHVFQTGVENYRQLNEAEKEQQRLSWLQQIRQYLPGTTSEEIEIISQTTSSPSPSPTVNKPSPSFRQWGHDITFWVKNWFINRKFDAQNNFIVQMMDQFGRLARSTGNFIYLLPLISQLYIIKKHIDWGRRVMKDHPSYGGPEKDDRDPRGPPKKDHRDPRSDGSGSAPGIAAYGGRRKRRKSKKKSKRKSRRKKKKSRRKRRKSRKMISSRKKRRGKY